jgi:dTDP-4-dehydrorhamnose 3,5-epimerase
MERLPTRIDGPVLLAPAVHRDERGFFCETYRASALAEHGIRDDFVQDNHSRSSYGVIRGIHFAVGEGSAKLVRCGRGSITDVVVDLRRGSPTFGEWEAFDLSDETMRLLYVPRGFGHGFCVTSEVADVLYKQSAYYDPAVEKTIRPDDPGIAIDWPVPAAEAIRSERDLTAPTLAEIAASLPFEHG